MIFFYGSSKEHILGDDYFPQECCPFCKQSGGVSVAFCYRYAHLYWIPFVGWKKAFGYCTVCNQRFVHAHFSPTLRESVAEMWRVKKYRVPIYAHTWLIIIGAFVIIHLIVLK